jgi:hypothetical protein
MVASAPQQLVTPARGQPTGGCNKQQYFFIGAPGQDPGDLLWQRPGSASYRARDRDIRLRRLDGYRKV